MNKNTAYLSTPIYYVNGDPHIGHGYTNIVTDVVARILVLCGYDVALQTGTDEHGQKVSSSAIKNGLNVMDFCTEKSNLFHQLAIDLNFSASYNKFDINNFSCYDQVSESIKLGDEKSLFANGSNFIRTTEGREKDGTISDQSFKNGRHLKFVTECWNKLAINGWIYEGEYTGLYSTRDECFYDESELINGKSPFGSEVSLVTEKVFFFKLSKLQKILFHIYQENVINIVPKNRTTEVLTFISGRASDDLKNGIVEGHLRDLCVSRQNLDWGIPVPNLKNQVIYVWLDALFNYMSCCGVSLEDILSEKNSKWNKELRMHYLGKDILRFHTIYWPAFIIGLLFKADEIDDNCDRVIEKVRNVLPTHIIANGWWVSNGEKMSKSLGNVVSLKDEIVKISETLKVDNQISVDYIRYFMIKFMPIGNDGDYNFEKLKEINNNDLANNVGNMINRSLAIISKLMVKRNLDSLEIKDNFIEKSKLVKQIFNLIDLKELTDIFNLKEISSMAINGNLFKFLADIMKISNLCNIFIAENKPWELLKNDNDLDRIFEILIPVLSVGVLLNYHLSCFIPSISSKVLDIFNVSHRDIFDIINNSNDNNCALFNLSKKISIKVNSSVMIVRI